MIKYFVWQNSFNPIWPERDSDANRLENSASYLEKNLTDLTHRYFYYFIIIILLGIFALNFGLFGP